MLQRELAGMLRRPSSMDLASWTIFSLLDKEFSAQIRLACVFGNLGNEALIVTKDDEVYALGSNGAGCLGLGDMHSTLAPKQVIFRCEICLMCYKKHRLSLFAINVWSALPMDLGRMCSLSQKVVNCIGIRKIFGDKPFNK